MARRSMQKLVTAPQVLAPALILAAAFAGPTAAQTVKCPGSKQPHPYGTFTFETASRVDPVNPANGGQYRFGVVSCVDHNDPINELYVRWLIPGPHGWVPAREKLESTPRLRL